MERRSLLRGEEEARINCCDTIFEDVLRGDGAVLFFHPSHQEEDGISVANILPRLGETSLKEEAISLFEDVLSLLHLELEFSLSAVSFREVKKGRAKIDARRILYNVDGLPDSSLSTRIIAAMTPITAHIIVNGKRRMVRLNSVHI